MKHIFPQFSCKRFKTFVWLLLIASWGIGLQAQTVNVTGASGTAGPYTTLRAAFTDINGTAQTGNNILITVAGTIAENTNGAQLNAGTWTTLTIRPTGGAPAIVQAAVVNGQGLIKLWGAENVTIDGLNSGGNSLTLANTNTSGPGTCTILFREGASNNTVKRCSILGSNTSNGTFPGGTILFWNDATALTGNDNNTISNNDIGPAGANLPYRAISSFGSNTTVANFNSGNTITGNRIFDYFSAGLPSMGIYLSGGTTDWTISNNRFYQTAVRTQVVGADHAAIWLAHADINNCTITDNIIGGQNSSGGGYYQFGGTANNCHFYPIYVTGHGTTTASNIQGNSISNITVGVPGGGIAQSAPFAGILITAGRMSIGTVSGNTIGSTTASFSIIVDVTSTSPTEILGIVQTVALPTNIANNMIGGILVRNNSAGSTSFTGIRASTSTSVTNTIENNTIGYAAAPNRCTSTGATSSQMIGIYNTLGAAAINGNTVAYLSNGDANVGTGLTSSISGIIINNTTAMSANNITDNTIHSLANNHATAAVVVNGILYNGPTGANVVARNNIHSLDLSSSSATSTLNGLNVLAGTTTFKNNMIRLGYDASGGSITDGCRINGISEVVAGTDNFYHNSVYIGGTGVIGTAATFAFQSGIITNVRKFQNNIFYNARSNGVGTGKHYAIRVGGTAANAAGLTCNYNDLLANGTGGILGLYNAIDRTTIVAWRTATGMDNNSINLDPNYALPDGAGILGDLHVANPSPVDAVGTLVGAVVDDFDHETRSLVTPADIGADAIQLATLGTYPNVSVIAGLNTTVTPSNAPKCTHIVAFTHTNFKGILVVDSLTGVVRVTNAIQAGVYTVTVRADWDNFSTAATSFILTVTDPNCSQGLFTNNPNVATGSSPYSLVIGDFNGDGNQDFATANINSSNVSIRLGNGLGGFALTTSIGVNTYPNSLAIGDFNGDGKEDLAIPSNNSNNVAIRLGDGLGGFWGSTNIAVGNGPSSIAIGDFNGDGRQDFATAGNATSTVSIRLGDGHAGFSGSTNVGVLSQPKFVALGDFNADGNQDFVCTHNLLNAVSIRLGDGLGGFAGATSISVGTQPWSVAVGDFDADGKQDLAVVNYGSSDVSICLGNGVGGFGAATNVAVGLSPRAIAIGDFNGDGIQDFATVSISSYTVSIRLGDGLGGFSLGTTVPVANSPQSVAVGDFNGDGRHDFAVGNSGSDNVSIRLGGANEIDITGSAITIVDGDLTPSLTDDTDFGSVNVGIPFAHTFTIHNTGNENLIIGTGAITITGADASMFVLSGITLPATIAPGGMRTFIVTFTPTSIGLKNATVTILNDDCSEAVYDFAIQGNGTAVVPITLTSWRGEQMAQSVMLYWTTAQEQETDHFEVERSLDGSLFEFLGKRAAAGNSDVEQSYSLPDDHPQAVNYYRLKTIDRNGDMQFSEVIRFDFQSDRGFSANLFPNPTRDHFAIATDRMLDQVSICTIEGKVLLQLHNVAPYADIDLSAIPNGVYALRIQSGEATVNQKLVVLKK